MTRDGGPAFPSGKIDVGPEWAYYPYLGMSLRDFFAAHAPTPPDWFAPEISPKPEPEFNCSGTSAHERACSRECGDSNWDQRIAWERARERQRLIQWPYVWADLQLGERERAS